MEENKQNQESKHTRSEKLTNVTLVGTVANLALTAFKFFAGYVGRSGAMIADAAHSLSDLATDFAILVFVKMANKPQDHDHDYGHGKYETMGTVIVGIALIGVAIGIAAEAILKIVAIAGNAETVQRPGIIAITAAVVSIVVKEWLFRYTMKVGKRENSTAVVANAWHHRSDAFSSIAALIGILGAYLLGGKWIILDPSTALLMSMLILKTSYDLVKPGMGELMERSLPDELEDEIVRIIYAHKVSDIHNLRTRRLGNSIVIECHLRLPGEMSVTDSHDITKRIEKDLYDKYGENTMIMIHVEPNKPIAQ
ncbi:MAG: cation transporter [Bacteroidales bacterium]|nr:cation transporter [Bacteroidales bacterium]